MNFFTVRFCSRVKINMDFLAIKRPDFKLFGTSSSFRERLSIDDDNFGEHTWQILKKMRKNPSLLLQGYANFFQEFKKLYKEKQEAFVFNGKLFELPETRDMIDMLFTFETEEDINKFKVFSDGTVGSGVSVGSLKLTQNGTGLFSGYINSNVKSDSLVRRVKGYAGMSTKRRLKSFARVSTYNWTYYNHMVFKVRGDGRTYVISLYTPGDYDEEKHYRFSYPLHTRGGPYWQITKVPFSKLMFTPGNQFSETQGCFPPDRVRNVAILATQVHGPFKLEIDYIGLEFVKGHRPVCPYETYYILGK